MPRNSSPDSSPVRFALCRRIDDLHLSDADFDVEHDTRRTFAPSGQRGVAVDTDSSVVLAEEANLTEAGMSVELGRHIAGERHEHVADADSCLDGVHGS